MSELTQRRGPIKNFEEAKERSNTLIEGIRDSLKLTIGRCFKRVEIELETGEFAGAYKVNTCIDREDVEESIARLATHRSMLMETIKILENVDPNKHDIAQEEWDAYHEELKAKTHDTLKVIDSVNERLDGFTFYEDYASFKEVLKSLDDVDKETVVVYATHVHQYDEAFNAKLEEIKTTIEAENTEPAVLDVDLILSGGIEFDAIPIDAQAVFSDGVLHLVDYVDRAFTSTPIPEVYRDTLILDEEKALIPAFFDEPNKVTYFTYNANDIIVTVFIRHYNKLILGSDKVDIRMKLTELPTDKLLALTKRDVDKYHNATESLNRFIYDIVESFADNDTTTPTLN